MNGNLQHGHARRGKHSRAYNCWRNMMRRCYASYWTDYHRYGGRGIAVCERWKDFPNFLEDMGEHPEGMYLDRINNDGNYEPGNCRWVTPKESAANRTWNGNRKLRAWDLSEIRLLIAIGISQREIAEEFGVCQQAISKAIRKKLD